jgi:hypothetical protein
MRKKGVHRDNQSRLYQHLKQIRTDRQPNTVEQLISQFIENWKDQEPEFVRYFQDHYVSRKEEWAVCYRDKSIPDTTAHAEAFHNLLKRVYSSKRNRYMRTLIEKLMQIEEDFFIKYKGSELLQTHSRRLIF